MPFIRYKAIKPNGQIYKGILNVNTCDEILVYVKNEGGKLISWKEGKPKKFKYNLNVQDSINFFNHMATMSKLKIPLLEAIHMLSHAANSKRLIEFSKSLSFCISRGLKVSEALRYNFKKTDPIVISILSAAENSGSFESAFTLLKDFYSWKKTFKRKIQTALRYPLLCFFVILLTIGFLLIFLVPKIKPLLLQNHNANFGISTKLLFSIQSFFSSEFEENFLLIFISTIFFISFYIYLLKKY